MASSTVNFPFHPSPPPSSDNGPTVIVIVFVSFGCIFFVALCFFALWCCFFKKRSKCCFFKKCKKTVEETDVIHMDEHRRVKEAIVEGPHGPETVVLSIEDDKHIDEKIFKNEKVEKERGEVVAESGEINASGHDLEAGESSSGGAHHTHHHLMHKP